MTEMATSGHRSLLPYQVAVSPGHKTRHPKVLPLTVWGMVVCGFCLSDLVYCWTESLDICSHAGILLWPHGVKNWLAALPWACLSRVHLPSESELHSSGNRPAVSENPWDPGQPLVPLNLVSVPPGPGMETPPGANETCQSCFGRGPLGRFCPSSSFPFSCHFGKLRPKKAQAHIQLLEPLRAGPLGK